MAPDPSSIGSRVFVIDDDEAALHSLLTLLRAEGLAAVGFSSAVGFLDALTRDHRGCVVTDVRMPHMDGVELLRRLRACGNRLPVIMITGHADIGVAVQAMKAGAAEFIEKPFESEVLLRLIRGWQEEDLASVIAHAGRSRIQQRLDSLTTRERQVLERVVLGDANKMIAKRLGISPRTVEIYRAGVMTKMQAASLSELVRLSLIAGAA
jgi:two-component system response regulator FixJ